MKRILIIGATSKIAFETMRIWASQGASLMLLARNEEKLGEMLSDLQARSTVPHLIQGMVIDIADESIQARTLQTVIERMGHIDEALIAYGVNPDQLQCERNPELALPVWQVNASSCAHWALLLASYFEMQKKGVLGIISSAAAERGRAKNYVYGASKAMISHLCAGLRIRLNKVGVRVLDIRPGFVKTPMTANMKQGLLFADAKKVGQLIATAMNESDGVVYAPGFWKGIMFIIRNIPYQVFRHLPI